MLNHAIKYLKLGLSVIPLHPRGKEPLIPWAEYQKRIADEAELKEWFRKWPNANLGLVTGGVSGVVVIDLDGPEGLFQALKLGLSSSVVSMTGNGKHLWYKHPGGVLTNAVRILPGVDIRAEGGYVVAPPSIHESGRRYRFLTPFVSSGALPLFPDNLIAKETITKSGVTVKTEFKPKLDIAKLLEDMKDGNIDDTLFTVCSRLRGDGYSMSDARILLLPHAERVGAEDGHLDEKIKHVWESYEPRAVKVRTEPSMVGRDSSSSLVIHSPANAESWKGYSERESTIQRFYTRYAVLDGLLQGGLKSERLFTVAALTGHAKTNFGIGLSRNLCERGATVLYFSTEFSYKKIWQRYIATLKDPQRFKEHAFHVFDGFTPNLQQVEEAIRQIKPDVFIFDHIQQISKDRDALSEFMKGCQFLQRKYNVQGIILAQLNRTADVIENGVRVVPRISMIEGSATIEQASSRVLLLSRNKMLPEYHEITGYLEKNDDGDTGIVQFALYRNPYHLEEI